MRELHVSKMLPYLASSEFKGGPRVSDVIEMLVDLESLVEINSLDDIPNQIATREL
jgi:hypothetical protein